MVRLPSPAPAPETTQAKTSATSRAPAARTFPQRFAPGGGLGPFSSLPRLPNLLCQRLYFCTHSKSGGVPSLCPRPFPCPLLHSPPPSPVPDTRFRSRSRPGPSGGLPGSVLNYRKNGAYVVIVLQVLRESLFRGRRCEPAGLRGLRGLRTQVPQAGEGTRELRRGQGTSTLGGEAPTLAFFLGRRRNFYQFKTSAVLGPPKRVLGAQPSSEPCVPPAIAMTPALCPPLLDPSLHPVPCLPVASARQPPDPCH